MCLVRWEKETKIPIPCKHERPQQRTTTMSINIKIPDGWKISRNQFIPFAARAAVAVNGKVRYVGSTYLMQHPGTYCIERV